MHSHDLGAVKQGKKLDVICWLRGMSFGQKSIFHWISNTKVNLPGHHNIGESGLNLWEICLDEIWSSRHVRGTVVVGDCCFHNLCRSHLQRQLMVSSQLPVCILWSVCPLISWRVLMVVVHRVESWCFWLWEPPGVIFIVAFCYFLSLLTSQCDWLN